MIGRKRERERGGVLWLRVSILIYRYFVYICMVTDISSVRTLIMHPWQQMQRKTCSTQFVIMQLLFN